MFPSVVCTAAQMRSCSLWFVGIVFSIPLGKKHRVSGPVTSVTRVDVQIFLKDPVYAGLQCSCVLCMHVNATVFRCEENCLQVRHTASTEQMTRQDESRSETHFVIFPATSSCRQNQPKLQRSQLFSSVEDST